MVWYTSQAALQAFLKTVIDILKLEYYIKAGYLLIVTVLIKAVSSLLNCRNLIFSTSKFCYALQRIWQSGIPQQLPPRTFLWDETSFFFATAALAFDKLAPGPESKAQKQQQIPFLFFGLCCLGNLRSASVRFKFIRTIKRIYPYTHANIIILGIPGWCLRGPKGIPCVPCGGSSKNTLKR